MSPTPSSPRPKASAYDRHVTTRGLALIAALIAGAVALLVLKVIGLVIKFALIIALLITVGAWLFFIGLAQKFRDRS